jgi:fatty-acid desaturase
MYLLGVSGSGSIRWAQPVGSRRRQCNREHQGLQVEPRWAKQHRAGQPFLGATFVLTVVEGVACVARSPEIGFHISAQVCVSVQISFLRASIMPVETMTTTTLAQPDTPRSQPETNHLNWAIIPVLTLFHVGAVAALFFFTWHALFLAIFLYWVTTGLGLGICYHRLLTHRSYATPKWLEYALTICAVAALEGGPLLWVATHRRHHQFADKEGDPHSPRDGKWWAHVGWILVGNALRPDPSVFPRYVPDLAADKFHVWLTKYHLLPSAILGLVLFAIGGFRFVLWGLFFRTVVGLHATWLVNSVSHIWGTRRFETRDTSTNNWWVALLSFGDGWHNNHHAYPVSARHGLKWYEIDLNWYTICLFKRLGLASHIHDAPPATRTYANQT